MKYIKLFEERAYIKLGNIYKHNWTVDGESRTSIAKLIAFYEQAFQASDTTKFGEFQGFYTSPEHCKGEPIHHMGILGNIDEDSIPTENEIKEYELLNQMNKYNL